MLEIKQLTRLQIIRYCEKLEKENKRLEAELEIYKKQYKHLMWEDRKKEFEELVDRNIDVAKRLADK